MKSMEWLLRYWALGAIKNYAGMKWNKCNDVFVLSPRALQLYADDHVAAIEHDMECSISSRSES